MKKEDLKFGNIVELRDGSRYIKTCIEGYEFVICDNICATSTLIFPLNEFDDELKGSNKKLDIVKVYEDYTCQKLLWKRKEKPKLTEDEKTILRNLPKKYRYITRDFNGNLNIFPNEPVKDSSLHWFDGLWWETGDDDCEELIAFNHLFQFITWEDENPYLISDLLED